MYTRREWKSLPFFFFNFRRVLAIVNHRTPSCVITSHIIVRSSIEIAVSILLLMTPFVRAARNVKTFGVFRSRIAFKSFHGLCCVFQVRREMGESAVRQARTDASWISHVAGGHRRNFITIHRMHDDVIDTRHTATVPARGNKNQSAMRGNEYHIAREKLWTFRRSSLLPQD